MRFATRRRTRSMVVHFFINDIVKLLSYECTLEDVFK